MGVIVASLASAFVALLTGSSAIATDHTRVAGACHRKIVLTTDRHPERDWSAVHAKINHVSTRSTTCAAFSWVREATL